MRLSLIIPVYNERATLRELVRRVVDVELDKELILVDDGSTDGSRELLAELEQRGIEAWLPPGGPPRGRNDVQVIYQPRNRGKGAALREGFRAATGDLVVVQDADLEYDPRDLPRLVQPIVDGDADVVYGSRFIGTPRRALYFWHGVVNKGLTLLSNMVTDLNLTDMETCYKVFPRAIIQSIELEEDRFGIEPELTAKLARRRLRVYEVPIGYRGRTYEEGKKIGWKDGVRAIWCIGKYGLWPDAGSRRRPAR